MIDRRTLRVGVTRRGLLLGAGLLAAPFVVRSRPANVDSITLPSNRDFPRDDLLIAPQTLYQRIVVDRQPVQLLDATTLATFRDSHIPGAVHVWWQDTMELNDPHFGKVLKPDDGDTDQGRRVRLLERLGVNPNEAVVVCGNTLDMPAARVCWFLRFLGVDASVLDGGRAAWLGINGPMDEHEGDVAETSIETVTPRQGFYLSVTDVAEQLEDPATRLIDLREPDEIEQGPFRGLEIPGATRIPRSAFAERWGSVRSAAELEQILDAARIDRVTRLILIGPTGLDAAISWLALSLLGVDSVIITDGGWHEWVETPGLPLGAAASRSPALFHRTA